MTDRQKGQKDTQIDTTKHDRKYRRTEKTDREKKVKKSYFCHTFHMRPNKFVSGWWVGEK